MSWLLLVASATASGAPASGLPPASCQKAGGGSRPGRARRAGQPTPASYLSSERLCDRGHLKRANACLAIKLPANAHADDTDYGTGWRCDRGFRLSEGSCRRLVVPDDGFLVDSSFGRGWQCERGFRADGVRCVAVAVPAHGYLRESGDDWDCERGYTRNARTCTVVNVPANAYLDTHGSDWKCERGYGRVGQGCVKLAPPANAFVDYSGNDWECADGFRRQTGACVARNDRERLHICSLAHRQTVASRTLASLVDSAPCSPSPSVENVNEPQSRKRAHTTPLPQRPAGAAPVRGAAIAAPPVPATNLQAAELAIANAERVDAATHAGVELGEARGKLAAAQRAVRKRRWSSLSSSPMKPAR